MDLKQPPRKQEEKAACPDKHQGVFLIVFLTMCLVLKQRARNWARKLRAWETEAGVICHNKDSLVCTVSSRPAWARARICSKNEKQAKDCWCKIPSSYHIPILWSGFERQLSSRFPGWKVLRKLIIDREKIKKLNLTSNLSFILRTVIESKPRISDMAVKCWLHYAEFSMQLNIRFNANWIYKLMK